MTYEYRPDDSEDNPANSIHTNLNFEGLENRNLLAADFDDSLAESRDLGQVGQNGASVSAEISEATDVDIYRMNLSAGETVDIDVDTATNGPGGLGGYLRVFNDQGVQIAVNNDGTAPGDPTSGFDPYLRFTAPASGQYFVAISNWQNIAFDPINGDGDQVGDQHLTGAYQLTIDGLPLTDANDAMSEAVSLGGAGPVSYTVNGQIDPDVDVYMYSLNIMNGQTVDFDIDTSQNGPGGLGSYVRLFDAAGRELAANNDAAALGETIGFDAYLRYSFASGGLYYLSVSNHGNTAFSPVTGDGDTAGSMHSTGAYQLTIGEVAPAQVAQSTASTSEDMNTGDEALAAPPVLAPSAAILSSSSQATQLDSGIGGVAANTSTSLDTNLDVSIGVSENEPQMNDLMFNELLDNAPPLYAPIDGAANLSDSLSLGLSQMSVFPGVAGAFSSDARPATATDVALAQL